VPIIDYNQQTPVAPAIKVTCTELRNAAACLLHCRISRITKIALLLLISSFMTHLRIVCMSLVQKRKAKRNCAVLEWQILDPIIWLEIPVRLWDLVSATLIPHNFVVWKCSGERGK